MIINIRQGIFETNSSSTHSICILSQEDFDNWENNQLYFDENSKKFLTYDEVKEFLQSINLQINFGDAEEVSRVAQDYDICTYEQYFENNGCFTTFNEKFVTKGGEKVIAFGRYGER